MNQEEFDNKLSDSFKHEHLPPDKRLWENISARLDEDNKKRFPLWLIPVFIAVIAAGAWLIGSIGPKTKLANETKTSTNALNQALATDTEANANGLPSEAASNIQTNTDENGGSSALAAVPTGYFEPSTTEEKGSKRVLNPTQTNRTSTTALASNGNSGITIVNTNTSTPLSIHPLVNEWPSNFDFNDIFLRKQLFAKPVLTIFSAPIEEETIANLLKTKKGKVIRSRYTKQPVDFDSKWWWSVGGGPQISHNNAIVPDDSVAKIHKDLWANRSLLTHNGTGFHAQFLLGHRIGEHFSFETGLQYGRHAEDIKLSVTSFAVETRDKHNNITAYEDSVLFWIVLSSNPTDTTYYYATRGFSLVTRNKYQIFTIPLKLNYEQNISPNTKIVAGIGAGFSGIRAKSVKHLNLINDTYFEEKKSTQFTASFSAQLGLFTNINEIGQLGFYTNLQLYAKPWELGNKQYAIRMSDLQFGLSFRRPLNWK